MEPADQRRDDEFGQREDGPVPGVPQWSPPINGGMTKADDVVIVAANWPQWSPPINGGMTHR